VALFPSTDDAGFEIPVYTATGDIVDRRRSNCDIDKDDDVCGILLNLERIDGLFDLAVDQPFVDSQIFKTNPSVAKYPQAFLHNIGQIQARRPLPLLTPSLYKINNVIATREEVAEENPGRVLNDDLDLVAPPSPPHHALVATSVQVYNRLLHHIAPRANEHAATLGQVTAAMAGKSARSDADRRKAEQAASKIRTYLPHTLLRHTAESLHASKDLRIEQVYVLRMSMVEERHQNGT
jgi:hypothetical protein